MSCSSSSPHIQTPTPRFIFFFFSPRLTQDKKMARVTVRDLGYTPGLLPPGPTNSLLDIPGLGISQLTLPTLPSSHPSPPTSTATKGCTLILPRPVANMHSPCHAGYALLNGNGELTGANQIQDWGYVNTPICFTNSLSLGRCFQGVWDWILKRHGERGSSELTVSREYGTPVVGETADWLVNSGRALPFSRLSEADVAGAFENVRTREEGGVVAEGACGGGAGMTCHQFLGGTGTASRIVGGGGGGGKEYTLAVLVQSNYGHLRDLQIGGVPVGKILQKEKDAKSVAAGVEEDRGADVHAPTPPGSTRAQLGEGKVKDGSILVFIATDAPLLPHQLTRLARHATAGLAQVGSYGVGRTHSGDLFLAVSTAEHPSEHLEGVGIRHLNATQTYSVEVVKNESIDPYFYAVAEATEEAILNSLVGSRDGCVSTDGTKIPGLPVDKVKELLRKHLVTV